LEIAKEISGRSTQKPPDFETIREMFAAALFEGFAEDNPIC
jgi:hypothetical protein